MPAAVWRGRLAFGMVAIPVRLYKAARRERIRFHRVYRSGAGSVPALPPPQEAGDNEEPETPLSAAEVHAPERPVAAEPPSQTERVERVRNQPALSTAEGPMDRQQILKGYEIEKDRYVTFQPAEVAALRPRTSTELEIAEFVRLGEIDPIFFETSYYVTPGTGGDKAYALLFRALAETGYAAMGSLSMHGRVYAIVVRPGGRGLIAHTLFYVNEVRAGEEYRSDPGLVSGKELELAKTLVTALAGPFEPAKLKDTFEERLRELIRARADTAVSAYEHGEVSTRAPVVDIMEALRKSLEMARKPPKSEKAGAKTGRTSQRRSRA
jgi:DNA end-binding protein Ku